MVKITVNYHLPSSATRDFCHPHNCKGSLCQDWYQWWQKGKETPFHQIFSISWRNWHLCYHRLCIDKHGPSLLLHRYWKPESISLDKTGFGSVWLLLNIKFSNISAIYLQVLRTRQIIRYRATATLRRPQKKAIFSHTISSKNYFNQQPGTHATRGLLHAKSIPEDIFKFLAIRVTPAHGEQTTGHKHICRSNDP